MTKLITKIILSTLLIFLFAIIMLAHLVDNHTEVYYENAVDFNSDSALWYIPSLPENAKNIYLRTFVETNDFILMFQIENNEDIKNFSLMKLKTKKSKDFLNGLNMPNERIKEFIYNGVEYCFISKEDSKSYLGSKYYLNNKKMEVLIVNLDNKKRLDICE